jgi:anaerobic ribonucleoside-triphosphate reductase activating protein
MDTGFSELPDMVTLNVYTVGCERKCDGCHNPELQDHNHPRAHEVGALWIAETLAEGLHDALCLLGGEPTEQPDLLEVLKEVRERVSGAVLGMYTGLEWRQVPAELKKELDFIKTGPWRGLPLGHKDSGQELRRKSLGGSWSLVKLD